MENTVFQSIDSKYINIQRINIYDLKASNKNSKYFSIFSFIVRFHKEEGFSSLFRKKYNTYVIFLHVFVICLFSYLPKIKKDHMFDSDVHCDKLLKIFRNFFMFTLTLENIE